MANRTYKFRIYPDASQKELFAKTFGCCRFLYNQMLADKIQAYRENGKSLRCTPAAYKKQYLWLKEVDSLALANVQLHLERAYRNFFEKNEIRFPKFRKKHSCRRSYTTNVVNGNIRLEGKHLRLPKAGFVRIRKHREIPEAWKLKSVTVSQDPTGKYFASLLYEYQVCENQAAVIDAAEAKILGIDFAMSGMAVFSDGSRAEYPMYYQAGEARAAREQRRLSRCVKGSRNYQKQKKRVAKCHEKIRNRRRDFQHKLSRLIADQYDAAAVEDLNMKAMSRSLHFGKQTMDNGYGQFREMLSYKLEERGKKLIIIDRFYPSSKRCSVCGTIKKELRLDERIYICGCGNCMDRDVNAAVNIREEGRRILEAA